MGTNGFKVKTEKDCFDVICSGCRQNLKFGDFTLLFCGVRQRNARKFMLHVQHDYFPFLTNHIAALWRCRSRSRRLCLNSLIGSFSNDNGDGNENVTNLHIQWAKTIALHAPHVRFSYLSISLPSSAKQQREITKFEVLRRTSALGDKFSFFSPKFSAARNGFIPEGPPHLCHIKKLGIVAKWSQ